MKLREIKSDELGIISQYCRYGFVKQNVLDFKVGVFDDSVDHWDFLAIKISDDISHINLFNIANAMKADEYHGMFEGYHIFWYD